MTDREWLEGWARVERAFASFAALPPEERAQRAAVYREALDDVKPEAWVHGARQAIKLERTTFLPAAGKLREYAETWRPVTAGELPAPRMSEAEREEARRVARAGIELCRQAVGAAAVPLADRVMPESADA